MNTKPNRVLLAISGWEDRKKELAPMLDGDKSDDQVLRRIQLTYLRQASHRLQETARSDERPFMALLQNNIKKLERQVYPNLLTRLFFSLKDRLFDGPTYLRGLASQRAENMEGLKQQLRKKGFGSVAGKLEDHLDPELKQGFVKLASQLDPENRSAFVLYYEKDTQGDFKLDSIRAELRFKGMIGQANHFQTNEWPDLHASQAINLLDGRALKQNFTDASGQENQRWVEYGKYGFQYYDQKYEFDVRSLVDKMPGLIADQPKLINDLESGQRSPAQWKVNQHSQNIFLETDPANKALKIFDDKGKPITPEKLDQNALKQTATIKSIVKPAQQTEKRVRDRQHV